MKEDEGRAMPEEPHGGEERPARQLKLTEKGRSYVLKEAELDRNKLGKKIRRLFESVKPLMESEENQGKVEEKLRLISSLNHELKEKQDILLEAERSQEERERHFKWDCENTEYYDESKEVVEGWLEQVSKSKGSRKEDTKPEEEGDEIEPGDSISNVSSQRSGRKSGSSASSVSRASARLGAKAELAALSIEADAMKKKHEMARQQEEMARCQEQLELDTKLKVAKARRDILESEGSRCSSRPSKAISSRERAKTAQSELAVESIPRSKSTGYLGLENLNRLSEPSAQQMGARPKLVTIRTSVQTREGPVDQGEGSQVGLLALLHKQSEFNEIMSRRNKSLILPPVEIPTYAGDPLEYETFVRALEEVLEKKVKGEKERLRFLVKYTQGKVKGLVESCQIEPDNQGYKKARRLLKERFGDEQRIVNAYIEKAHDWKEIKPEDVDKLSEYAIFLRRCCSSMKNLGYMEEINLSSNMRIIISKLPRRMREKWRDRAGEIRDKSKQVARLPDLVEYLEREVRYMSDSCSGIIEEAKPLAIYKGSTYVKTKQKTGPKKSNFATNIIPEKVLGGAKEDAPTRNNEFCPFCDEVGHTIRWCRKFKEKKYEKKMDFLKRNGICYGCLKKGHMVKDCKCPIVCDKCKQNHPDVLHTVKKEPDHTEQKKESADVNAITSPQVTAHIGAGEKACIFSILPVQVRNRETNVVLQTYAFLDHGSSATFCTENLMRRLDITGEKVKIQMRTMNKEKDYQSYYITNMEISSLDEDNFIPISEVFTHETMPVGRQNVPRCEDLQQWPYLKEVKITKINSDIDLLIGTNALRALEPVQIIRSQKDGPYAMKTLLGWVIYGSLCKNKESTSKMNCRAVAVNQISTGKLEKLLMKQYNHDFNESTSQDLVYSAPWGVPLEERDIEGGI
ncbi:uncharacterized protein LOC129715113 [Leucoraja erinacea]|uniref:uncharacterized protein LOC129715113 n=1 Tax=Leucoraja erinaceus TaxID=7782 RepID=UPI002458FFAD|nr:uncharacterized protein LOC129715113 [Leucoraja erinacea]XP_055520959.1 uncharacterized protein LOC129715113 [Leucoraja erinacea]